MGMSILLGIREPSTPTRLAPGAGWLAWLQPKSPEQLIREALASGNLPPLGPTGPDAAPGSKKMEPSDLPVDPPE